MDLIDSSVWVEYLRATGSRANVEVRMLIRERPEQIAITEPIVMELLAGAPDESALGRLQTLTGGLRLLAVEPARDFHDAAFAYRAVRAGGRTVRKLQDCLIAAVAMRTGATLVHRDRDFDVLAAALPDLRVRSLL